MTLTRPLRVVGALVLTAVLGLHLTGCDAIYEPGKVYRLDTISWLAGINDAGIAVGTWGSSGAIYNTKLRGRRLVFPPAGWFELHFTDINDAGLVVGYVVNYGPPREQAVVYNSKTGGIRVIQLPSGLNMTTSLAVDDAGRVLLSGWRRWEGPGEGVGNYLYDHRDRSLHPLTELVQEKLHTSSTVEVNDISSDGILVGYTGGLPRLPGDTSFVLNWDRQTIATLPNTPGRPPAMAYTLNRNGIAAGADVDCSRSYYGACFETPYVYDRWAKRFVSLKAGTPEGPVTGVSDAGIMWGPLGATSGEAGWWYDLAAKRGGAVPAQCLLAAVNDARIGVANCGRTDPVVYRVP